MTLLFPKCVVNNEIVRKNFMARYALYQLRPGHYLDDRRVHRLTAKKYRNNTKNDVQRLVCYR